MKKTKKELDYASDYALFSNQEKEKSPPTSLTFKVRDKIKSDLEPDLKKAFLNLLAIHFVSGGLTLSVCPQFGVGPYYSALTFFSWIESQGHLVCGIFCGSFFVFLTTLLSWVILKKEIQKIIQQNQFVFYLMLGFLSFSSLILFSMMQNNSSPHLHLEFTLAWIVSFTLFPVTLNTFKKYLPS